MSRVSTRAGRFRKSRWVLGALPAALILLLALAGTASAASFVGTFTNSGRITIPDSGPASPYPSTLDVSGVAGAPTDVDVVLYGVQHTYLADLYIYLVGPHGESVVLMDRVGESGDSNDADVTFDDASSTDITWVGLTPGATYRPVGSLAAFNGVDPNGTWQLFVLDRYAGDFGSISRGWSVVVTVDTTAPVTAVDLAPAANAAGWNNSTVTATLTATDDVSDVAGTEFRLAGATTWTPYAPFTIDTEGATTWEYHSIDTVGNDETPQQVTVKLDKTSPVTTATGLDGLWHDTPVTVGLSAEDQAGLSGVAGTEYSLDGAGFVAGTSLTIDTVGSHTVDFRSTDVAGNVETAGSGSVGYDATGPATTDDAPSDWQTASPVIVTLKPDDGAGCGMTGGAAKTEYKIDGASSWSDGTSVAVAGDGVHTVTYRSTDALGNVGAQGSCAVKIDTSAPTIAVSGNDDSWHPAPVTLTVTPSAGSSGVASVECKIGDGSWTTLSRADGAYRATVSAEGKTTVGYRATSVAGVRSATGSCTVKIDTSAPTIAVSGGDGAWRTKPAVLTFTPSAGASGVGSVEYRFGNGDWTKLEQAGGAYTVRVSANGKTVVRYRATSVVGLESAVGSCTVRIDGGAPTLRLATRTLRIWTRSGGDQRLRLRWNDGDSTRARLRVRVTQYSTKRQKDFSFTIGRRDGTWQTVALPWRPSTPGRYALHLALYDQAGRRCDAAASVVAYR